MIITSIRKFARKFPIKRLRRACNSHRHACSFSGAVEVANKKTAQFNVYKTDFIFKIQQEEIQNEKVLFFSS